MLKNVYSVLIETTIFWPIFPTVSVALVDDASNGGIQRSFLVGQRYKFCCCKVVTTIMTQ